MKIDDVRRTAYSMPLTNPSFPPGPYRSSTANISSSPIAPTSTRLPPWCPSRSKSRSVVKYEFIRMPDSTGFGDYTETAR